LETASLYIFNLSRKLKLQEIAEDQKMSTENISIIIADDHRLLREGLRCMLEKQSGLKPVAEADDGRTTVKLVERLKPDVVVMDVSMPDMNGIEATRQIKKEFPSVKVIGLSMHADKRFVTEMLKAGASGYLLKHCAFEELGLAIRTVAGNRIYLSAEITGVVIEDYMQAVQNGKKHVSNNGETLSNREREVLQLLAEGKSAKDIAARLNLSVKTVETHRQNIMEKLHLFSIAELTKYAIAEGLTELPCVNNNSKAANHKGNPDMGSHPVEDKKLGKLKR
jgi:two-component system response regulator NreC